MLRETPTLNRIIDLIKRNPDGVTQKTISLETGFSQSYVSRVLVNLQKAKAITKHESTPTPNGLPGPSIFKYNPKWSGYDAPSRRGEYGLDLTYGGKAFNLEQGFQRLVTHKNAHEYLTLTGNFRSALANSMIYYLGQDLLNETEPVWDDYRSALQLALSFINTQANNGSFSPESSDAIAFRKAAGYYA